MVTFISFSRSSKTGFIEFSLSYPLLINFQLIDFPLIDSSFIYHHKLLVMVSLKKIRVLPFFSSDIFSFPRSWRWR